MNVEYPLTECLTLFLLQLNAEVALQHQIATKGKLQALSKAAVAIRQFGQHKSAAFKLHEADLIKGLDETMDQGVKDGESP